MMRTTAVAALLTLLTLAPTAGADELRLVGERHTLTGRAAGRTYAGWVDVRDDATYVGERRFADGAVERLAGRAAIEGDDLVLTAERGAAGALQEALGGAGGAGPRRFERADEGRTIRWRWADGQDEELLAEPGDKESRLELVGRLLRRKGVLNWLLNDNLGLVDQGILRGKQPSPNDVDDLRVRRGVRTVLSLNGPLDRQETWWPPLAPGEEGPPRSEEVDLGAFIASRGLEHPFVRMSARRAPSDAELVAVFRVLLDDSKKPIYLHCQGGSDRTGIIAALYQVEFLGVSKEAAKKTMRRHLWLGRDGTEVQGAYLDLYQPGTLTRLLTEHGVSIPPRLRLRSDAPPAPPAK